MKEIAKKEMAYFVKNDDRLLLLFLAANQQEYFNKALLKHGQKSKCELADVARNFLEVALSAATSQALMILN
ncbi:MAG: hypothetical protein SGPRY_012957 [Prymnesium sp.]